MYFIDKRQRWSEAEHKHRLVRELEKLGLTCIQELKYGKLWFDIVITHDIGHKDYLVLDAVIECKVDRGRTMAELKELEQISKYRKAVNEMGNGVKLLLVSFDPIINHYKDIAFDLKQQLWNLNDSADE